MRAKLPHAPRAPPGVKHQLPVKFCRAFFLIWVLGLGYTISTSSRLQHQAHQTDVHPGSLPSLDELYGPQEGQWPASAAAGPSQLLLLSYYASKASLAARLLMLMGVYAGDATQLRIDGRDKLRWWELHQLTTLNDLMLQQHTSPGLPPRLGRGFHTSALSREEHDYYQDRLQGIVRYLGQRKPWLVKDPRLSWLAPLWLERLESPVCVLVVDMQPDRLAHHLAQQQQLEQRRKQPQQLSGELEVSDATHLERWTNSTLSAVKACFGMPTLILPNSMLQPPLLELSRTSCSSARWLLVSRAHGCLHQSFSSSSTWHTCSREPAPAAIVGTQQRMMQPTTAPSPTARLCWRRPATGCHPSCTRAQQVSRRQVLPGWNPARCPCPPRRCSLPSTTTLQPTWPTLAQPCSTAVRRDSCTLPMPAG